MALTGPLATARLRTTNALTKTAYFDCCFMTDSFPCWDVCLFTAKVSLGTGAFLNGLVNCRR